MLTSFMNTRLGVCGNVPCLGGLGFLLVGPRFCLWGFRLSGLYEYAVPGHGPHDAATRAHTFQVIGFSQNHRAWMYGRSFELTGFQGLGGFRDFSEHKGHEGLGGT